MYLSKAQVDGLSDIVSGKMTVMRPELLAFILENELVYMDLFEWLYTPKAGKWLAETRHENEQLQKDFSANKFTTGRRDQVYSNSQSTAIPVKRKTIESQMNLRPKPETRYKEIK